METNSSSTNLLFRSKKLPPPPLCLPATNSTVDDEKNSDLQIQRERKKSSNNCCLSSTADECSHQSISYILPTSKREQILETLITTSSVLLTTPSSYEGKHRRSSNGTYANYINLLKQRQTAAKLSIADTEWLDFMRLIVQKSFEQDLKSLLDKYKMTYFDRVNASNITDETIRSSLCNMVAEALSTYSSTSTLSSALTTDDMTSTINSSSSSPPINNISHGSSKRKRKNTNSNSLSLSAPMAITNQTKFVVSYLIPGKYENNNNLNGNKMTNQQKQFQKKYSHLFKYIPENDVQEYLIHEDYLKSNSSTSQSTDNHHICLMLYDEVITHMDEYDLQISGISVDDCFTLPNSIVTQIDGFSQ